ncbi:MAG TPA: penicillin-binding protein 2 [Kiritimatiellia bacterium]|nr:penicillin-binding protein 2 [Kiritimatiellia bacterium]
MNDKRQGMRLILVAVTVALVWTGLGLRLAFLHLGDHEEKLESVRRTHRHQREVLVGRGRIFDRNEHLIAMDLGMKHVSVDPSLIQDRGGGAFIAHQLGRLLEVDPAMIFAKINRPGRKQEYVKKFVLEDSVQPIRAMGLHGVFFEDVSARHYPRGPLMSHVIGFSNLEGYGSAGIELRYDRYLRGIPGFRVTEVDRRGREVYSRRSIDIVPRHGADITLTIDGRIQHFTERALDQAMEETGALGAWAIVQHVRTGEILAMASRPTFDPNHFRTATDEERRNRAVSMVFEPGSIFKVAVIAGVLNERLFRPSDIIFCENGRWMHAGKPLNDFRPYGHLTVADVLKKSSNIGTAKMALELGNRKVYDYLKNFGFGVPTGIGLPGEEAGILRHPSSWTALSLSRICMGHEVMVTGIQMVNMMTVLGNNGFLIRPRVVKRVVDARGETIYEPDIEVLGRPISGATARLMVKLLTRATEEGGTGRHARMDNYTVAGKTGTAEKVIDGRYSRNHNIASFIGLVPAERPELSILVVIDEPSTRTGGAAAAPVFRQIAEPSLRYLDIQPIPRELAYRFGDEVPYFE